MQQFKNGLKIVHTQLILIMVLKDSIWKNLTPYQK